MAWPTVEQPCDPVVQQQRQDALEQLYAADGRHDPAHPLHALFSGLVMQAAQASAPEAA